jgi:hypothetical protein
MDNDRAVNDNSPATGINLVGTYTFPVGVTNIQYYIEDAAGNSASCSFSVTVTDNQNPVISCPGDIAVNNDTDQCSAEIVVPAPVTSDNCGVVLQTWTMTGAVNDNSPATGINLVGTYTFPVGVTNIQYYIEDAAGNSASCSFSVTVTDNQNPVISCPGDIAVNNDTDQCSAEIVVPAPVTSDNCGVVLQTWTMTGAVNDNSPATGINLVGTYTFPVGVTNIQYYIEDAAGNSASCSFSVTVTDNQNPVISCPGDIAVNNDTDQCSAEIVVPAPVTSDNCGVVLQTWTMTGAVNDNSPATGINLVGTYTFPVGVTNIQYYIEDAAGNSASCSFSVTVTDNQNPVISCPGDIAVNNDTDQCSAEIVVPAPVTSDNCGVVLQTWTMTGAVNDNSPATGINLVGTYTFPVGVTNIQYYIEDAAGNSASCSFSVTVTDNQNPVISCPGDIAVNNDTDQCSAEIVVPAPLLLITAV